MKPPLRKDKGSPTFPQNLMVTNNKNSFGGKRVKTGMDFMDIHRRRDDLDFRLRTDEK